MNDITPPTVTPSNFQAQEAYFDEFIQRLGFGVKIERDKGGIEPTHAYTVGLVLSQGVELVAAVNRKGATIHAVMTETVNRMRAGESWKGGFTSEHYKVRLGDGVPQAARIGVRKIIFDSFNDFVGIFHKRAQVFPLYQLILPDDNNVLPGEPGYASIALKQKLYPTPN